MPHKLNGIDWSNVDGQRYRYAASAIEVDGKRYLYYCANIGRKDRPVITDHIALRVGERRGEDWVYGDEKVVLWPGEKRSPKDHIWDWRHVCDPDVVAGEFTYRPPELTSAVKFRYAMFYLGIDREIKQGGSNHIGVAVSENPEGPWYKVTGFGPIIKSNEDGTWGVGQPAVTSIDRKGRVQLFYTRGDSQGTRTLMQELDLSNAHHPVLKGEVPLSVAGLTKRDGSPDPVNHGGAFLFDEARNRLWTVRSGHPFPSSCPKFVADFVQVAWMDTDQFTSPDAKWTVASNHFARSLKNGRLFDPGFIKDPWGCPLEPDRLDFVLSTSGSEGRCPDQWLYSYRIHELTLTITE